MKIINIYTSIIAQGWKLSNTFISIYIYIYICKWHDKVVVYVAQDDEDNIIPSRGYMKNSSVWIECNVSSSH